MNTNYMALMTSTANAKPMPIRINQDRMQTALTADTFAVPQGLSREQLRRFIIDSGKK
ncbi:hypothetical protein RJJ65_34260 [Rhizobium hidalgonense]|jgi:hypothetical protein|uniref:Uncharacterized protein n=1 Tax=Rhizobium hidalgonense TaxID=1538159 RepID=A0AAJ2GZ18_9HYPH|nr:hypothetical protein [Rhizobium hidalgonense]MDR9777606.1 hypothetical protein [Rhizobium hidalgonense]